MDAIIINDKTHILVKNNGGIGNNGCEECSLIDLCPTKTSYMSLCYALTFKKNKYHFELK